MAGEGIGPLPQSRPRMFTSVGSFILHRMPLTRVAEAMSQPDPHDAMTLAPPNRSRRRRRGPRPVIGVPREYLTADLPATTVAGWQAALDALRASDAGVDVQAVSLPHTAAALPAYYIISSAEASSNLARYDGIRYGPGSSRSGGARVWRLALTGGDDGAIACAALLTPPPRPRLPPPPPGRARPSTPHGLEELRSTAFGPEVQRRLLMGTYALSAQYAFERSRGLQGTYRALTPRSKTLSRGTGHQVLRQLLCASAACAPQGPRRLCRRL